MAGRGMRDTWGFKGPGRNRAAWSTQSCRRTCGDGDIRRGDSFDAGGSLDSMGSSRMDGWVWYEHSTRQRGERKREAVQSYT